MGDASKMKYCVCVCVYIYIYSHALSLKKSKIALGYKKITLIKKKNLKFSRKKLYNCLKMHKLYTATVLHQ